MIYQITAFDMLGGVQLQVTTAEATENGYGWEHRMLELISLPEGIGDEPWDVLWAIAQRIQEVALDRGRRQ